jgi:hypothetical protein
VHKESIRLCKVNFIIYTPCILLQSSQQPTNAIDRIHIYNIYVLYAYMYLYSAFVGCYEDRQYDYLTDRITDREPTKVHGTAFLLDSLQSVSYRSPCLLWYPKVHCRSHKSQSRGCVINNKYQIQSIISNAINLKTHLKNIIPFTP